MTMPYYEAPAEMFEDAEAMRHWTDRALDAGLAANAAKAKAKR